MPNLSQFIVINFGDTRRNGWAHHDLPLNLRKKLSVRSLSWAIPLPTFQNLGVSAHSHYKWLRSVKPDNSGHQAQDMLHARTEIIRLKAQLKRTEEERDILKKAAVLCNRARLKYRFINDHRDIWSIAAMCRFLKVARAGFYVWLHRPVSAGEKDNQRLLELIRDSYALSGGVYGYRRVYCDLREVGEACSRNLVAKIMKQNRIRDLYGYKTPRGAKGRPSLIAPNHLKREFTVVKPNQAWCGDVIYSVPGVQGEHGCSNEPRVCLEY